MWHDPVEAEVLCRVVADAGHDVPAHPTFAQMVERRHLSGEVEGMLLQDGTREGETEMFRGGHQRRGKHARIVDGDLHRFLQIRVPALLVRGVHPQDIGDEEGVELAALEQLRKFDPSFEVVELRLPGIRPAPESVKDVGYGVHGEAVEDQTLWHGRTWR
jgi:hypothetical protein